MINPAVVLHFCDMGQPIAILVGCAEDSGRPNAAVRYRIGWCAREAIVGASERRPHAVQVVPRDHQLPDLHQHPVELQVVLDRLPPLRQRLRQLCGIKQK